MKCNNCLITIDFEVVRNIFPDLTLALLWGNGAVQTKSTFGIDFNEKGVWSRERKRMLQREGQAPAVSKAHKKTNTSTHHGFLTKTSSLMIAFPSWGTQRCPHKQPYLA